MRKGFLSDELAAFARALKRSYLAPLIALTEKILLLFQRIPSVTPWLKKLFPAWNFPALTWDLNFSFSGRSPRPEMWGFFFLSLYATILMGIVALVVAAGFLLVPMLGQILLIIASIGFILGITILGWANLALTTRRLHDRGMSGWWTGLYVVFFVFGSIVTGLSGGVSNLILTSFQLVVFALLALLPGEPYENKYDRSCVIVSSPDENKYYPFIEENPLLGWRGWLCLILAALSAIITVALIKA